VKLARRLRPATSPPRPEHQLGREQSRQPAQPPGPDPELLAERERLTQRFALMQSELGGVFYEMAIRDHVQMEVLIEKAAALQRVDAELGQLEHLLHEGDGTIGGRCPSCGAAHALRAAFCSQCAAPLSPAR
jgi:hypothetical protein